MAAQLSYLTPELATRRYPDIEFLVTREWAEKFFRSVSYPTPPHEELPYSFLACLRDGEFEVFRDLGIDLKQLLHVSQTHSYHKPVKIGDRIVSKVGVQKIAPRKLGGELVVFIELYNKYFRDGELIAEAGGSVIVREVK